MWKQLRNLGIGVLSLLFIGCAAANNPSQKKITRTLDLKTSYNAPDLKLQTPSGGKPGSSSSGRPTGDELGIDNLMTYSGEFRVAKGNNTIFAGGEYIKDSGDAVLSESLTSQGKSFDSGSEVKYKVQLHNIRAGYLRDFNYENIRFSPGFDLDFLLFHYELENKNGSAKADREYSAVAPRIGAELEVGLTENTSLESSVFYSPKIFNLQTHEADIKLRYMFTEEFGVFIGAGYKNIDFEDGQELPNHIEFESYPFFFGIRLQN